LASAGSMSFMAVPQAAEIRQPTGNTAPGTWWIAVAVCVIGAISALGLSQQRLRTGPPGKTFTSRRHHVDVHTASSN
jgi:hypothetical protein